MKTNRKIITGIIITLALFTTVTANQDVKIRDLYISHQEEGYTAG